MTVDAKENARKALQARQHALAHLPQIAYELQQWQRTGILRGDRLREVAGLLDYLRSDERIEAAKNMALSEIRDEYLTRVNARPNH